VETVRTGEPSLPPDETLDVLRVLVAGRRSLDTDTPVEIDDLSI
jgi:hypothetical protein